MSAQAAAGPVMVQDPASASTFDSMPEPDNKSAPNAPSDDEVDEGDIWESESILADILEASEDAYEESGPGEHRGIQSPWDRN